MRNAALDHDRLVTSDLTDPTWIAQAALVAYLHPVALHDLRVDEAPDLVVVALHDAHPQQYPDLVCRQARAGGVEHGLGEIVDQPLDGHVHARDFFGLFAQDRMVESEDWSDSHVFDFTRGLLAPNRLNAE